MGLIEDYEKLDSGRSLKIQKERVQGYVVAIKSSLAKIREVKSAHIEAEDEIDSIVSELRVLIKSID